MDQLRLSGWLAVTLLLLAGTPLLAEGPAAEHPPAGKIRIADRPGEDFTTIQAALDAAPADAVVLVGEGRYPQRLKITKPVKLVGAGTDRTVIGPYRGFSTVMNVGGFRGRADVEGTSEGVIKIAGVRKVELRSLRVTVPGTPRPGADSRSERNAIVVDNADLSLIDCAVVGCLGNGVHAVGASNLQIDDCLIAACWETGVVTTRLTGELRITNSDIRNCYHDDVMAETTSDLFEIEGCRISGSAGFGVRIVGGRPAIRQNAIFENAQVGIAAYSDCMIKQNLIFRNEAGGAMCCGEIKGLIAGNLFFDNDFVAIRACGACQPIISRNVFVGSGIAVQYGPLAVQQPVQESLGKYYVKENLFWRIDQPLELCHVAERGKRPRTEAIELPINTGNRVDDPQISLDAAGQVVLGTSTPAEPIDLTGIAAVTTKSRWPLADEERVLVSDDGSPDWLKWKMQPPAVGKKP